MLQPLSVAASSAHWMIHSEGTPEPVGAGAVGPPLAVGLSEAPAVLDVISTEDSSWAMTEAKSANVTKRV